MIPSGYLPSPSENMACVHRSDRWEYIWGVQITAAMSWTSARKKEKKFSSTGIYGGHRKFLWPIIGSSNKLVPGQFSVRCWVKRRKIKCTIRSSDASPLEVSMPIELSTGALLKECVKCIEAKYSALVDPKAVSAMHQFNWRGHVSCQKGKRLHQGTI